MRYRRTASKMGRAAHSVLKDGASATKEDLISYVSQHIAKFWIPDDVVFVPDLPHTATGKLHKEPLREQYANHLMV